MENMQTKPRYIDSEGNDLSTAEGTRAFNEKMEKRRKRQYTPVSPGSTTYYYDISDEDVFNVRPLLKALSYYDREAVIISINHAMEDIVELITEHDGKSTYSGMTLAVLRTLQNGLMSGYGIFDMDEDLVKEENK